jgi:hypothetical protein
MPLSGLSKGLLHAMLEFEKSLGARVPVIPPDVTGAQAVDLMRNASFTLFPGLRTKT